MLREQQRLITSVHKALDIGLTVVAFVCAYFLRKHLIPYNSSGLASVPDYYVVILLIVIIWYSVFGLFRLYDSYRRQILSSILWKMFKAVSVSTSLLFVAIYLLNIREVSRILLGIFFLFDIGLLASSKGIVYKMLQKYRKRGFNFRNVLIIGSRARARDVIEAIGENLGAGFRVLGCLETEPNRVGDKVKRGVSVIDTVDAFIKILKEHVVDEVIFAMPLKRIAKADQYIAMAEEIGVAVRIIPDWQIHSLTHKPDKVSVNFEEFLGVPSMTLTMSPQAHAALYLKSLLDFLMASIIFLFFLPQFIVIICAIKIVSPGPVFFRQERCGLNGRRFTLYKFRTMVKNAEERLEEVRALNEADGPVFKIRKDPRLIPGIGPLLRRTSLDELPQMINVLRGEMSIVGPRPPIPEEVGKYETWQRRRLSMKPGLTCTWQCAPKRNDIDFDAWMKMDLIYIDNWSLWLDFKILVRTAKAMMLGEGR